MQYLTSAFLLVGLILTLYMSGQPRLETPEAKTVFQARAIDSFRIHEDKVVKYDNTGTFVRMEFVSKKVNLPIQDVHTPQK